MRISTIAIAAALALASGPAWAAPAQTDAQIAARVAKVLSMTPLIDGHNDLPWEVRERYAGKVGGFDLKSDLTKAPPAPNSPGGNPPGGLMTDIPRLHAGHLGGDRKSVV